MKTITKVSIMNSKGIQETIVFDAINIKNENNIPISIYYDDTVQTVKYKIMEGLKRRNIEGPRDNINYEELYLFSIVERDFDVFYWYKCCIPIKGLLN